jgi:hypothetical protein
MAPALLALPEPPTTTAPDTVSFGLPVVANVKVAVPLPEPITTLAQTAVEMSTVTVTPTLIVTVSPATGTACPPQVAVLLQLLDTLAVLAAAFPDEAPSNMNTTATKNKDANFSTEFLPGLQLHRFRYVFIDTGGWTFANEAVSSSHISEVDTAVEGNAAVFITPPGNLLGAGTKRTPDQNFEALSQRH